MRQLTETEITQLEDNNCWAEEAMTLCPITIIV